MKRWWVWKDGIRDDRECFVAYDREYPVYPDGGDPLTLGEPAFSGDAYEVRAWRPNADIDFKRVRGRDDHSAQ